MIIVFPFNKVSAALDFSLTDAQVANAMSLAFDMPAAHDTLKVLVSMIGITIFLYVWRVCHGNDLSFG